MQHPIHFWYQDSVQTINAHSAGRSVLNYLRRDCGQSGTKEGCAEGDCGACSVLVVKQSDTGLVFESVNACIHPVANLHGKVLLGVEDLVQEGKLHPVQTAMVEAHASQCGFCTPGFVMSLSACHEQNRCNQTTANRLDVQHAISGNLCRCTGYRPIVEAGLNAMQHSDGLNHQSLTDQLKHVQDAVMQHTESHTLNQTGSFLPEGTTVLTPRSINELNAAVAEFPDAVLTAGMTDVGLWINKQLRDIPVMISTTQVAELHGIHHTDFGLDIGAAVSLSELAAQLLAVYPELHEWHERFASVPIRNAATLGGNIIGGSPIGDSMPVLLVLNARLLLQKGDQQRLVDLKDFYLGYQKKDLQTGEFLRRIQIPKRSENLKLAVYKISKRFEDDISAVCTAVAFKVEHQHIVQVHTGFGGVAAIPATAPSVEAFLEGKPFTADSFHGAAAIALEAFSPLSDHRASAQYRKQMCANVFHRMAAQWFDSEPSRVYTDVVGAI